MKSWKSLLAVALSFVVIVGSVAWANHSAIAQATDTDEDVYQLTGLPSENTAWRPVAVSVNSTAARSLGMSKASVVYEVLAQGYETNMALLFNNIWEMPITGPVDQATDILWQFAISQNAILIQNGWNIYAENLLNCYAYQPIDAMIEGTTAFTYDNGGDTTLANEYCWYANNVAAYLALESYGISAEGESGMLFSFGENATAQDGAQSLWLQYSASAGAFFAYDSASGLWMMTSAVTGTQIDANNGEEIGFDNVFVLYAESSIKDDGYTREYDLSEGTGIYLTDGTWQTITWYKGDVTDTLVVLDATGAELVVNTGTSYIGIYGGFSGQAVSLTTDAGVYDATVFDA